MSDQPLTVAFLEQFFRSFARPDLDRVVEERMEESRERGRRLYFRLVAGSLESLETMYGFLHADVRRLERRLDEIHVLIDRSDFRRLPQQLEIAHYKYEDAVAAPNRLKGYLADLGESIERIETHQMKDTLRKQAMDLRRRVEDLAAPLDIAGSRLNRYAQRVAAGTLSVEPRTSAGTEER
jgi:hypothetical protein